MTRKMKSFREVEDEDTDGCECCMQWSLLVVNLPVLLMGAAMIIISVYNFAERSYLDELHLQSSALYSALSVTMLIAGLILMVLAVLGCVAAFIENKRVILVYYICVLCVFAVVCALVIVGFVYNMKLANYLRTELRVTALSEYNPDKPSDRVTKAWDRMQSELKCCGVSDAEKSSPPWFVWKLNKRLNSGDAEFKVPESCCVAAKTAGQGAACFSDDENGQLNEALIYTEDCFTQASHFLGGYAKNIGVCLVTFSVALILAAVLSICLFYLADEE